jgi:mRNA interferase RelE/StbE
VASYKLVIKRSAAKELEAVGSRKDRRRIVVKIRSLAVDPRPPGCQKLSGSEKYRVRQGSYRILYSIEDDRLVVTVVRIAHRREAYRGQAG